nr:MAG TPA: hypothetical protein [Bacteriophage sp.]
MSLIQIKFILRQNNLINVTLILKLIKSQL